MLFTYLHLAPDLTQTKDLMASGATCIAYETVTAPGGGLPLLTPMSEVAGRLAPQVGAHAWRRRRAGAACCSAACPACRPRKSSFWAAASPAATRRRSRSAWARPSPWSTARPRCCAGSRRSSARRSRTIFSTRDAIAQLVRRADLLIGAVLVPGAAAPKLVTRDMVKTMKPGSVIVDIAIDQGGCIETSRPTTHSRPRYVEEGVVHYCVTNMPGSVARTSTFALNNVTLPFTLMLADKGWKQALRDDPHLRAGLNVHDGEVYCAPVAEAHELPAANVEELLAS